MNSTRQWFAVDKEGLAKVVRRRGVAFVLYELLQNAWDTRTASVRVSVRPVANGRVRLCVEDQDPDGFKDLTHAYTLYAESEKKGDAAKRGRFNIGEKLVLALCERAAILSTKGTVRFDKRGRHATRKRIPTGSLFSGELRMNQVEMREMLAAVQRVLPPIPTYVNGELIPSRSPIGSFEAVLPTELADSEGVLRRTRRRTLVRVYGTGDGDPGTLYELGIPVCETGDPWTVEIMQKVPLNADRDNVTPAYLRELRVSAVNAMHELMAPDAACTPAVQEAIGDPRVDPEAVTTVLRHQFGERKVVFDPSDLEANKRACSEGYNVIPGSAYSAAQWARIKQAGTVQPAGKVFPTLKPFSDDPEAKAARFITQDKWTDDMRVMVAYTKRVAWSLLEHTISVAIENEATANHAACYGNRRLVLNYGKLGRSFFAAPLWSERVCSLLIHELAHDTCLDHLSAEYHRACCELGARLARLALEWPDVFRRDHWTSDSVD